MMKKITKTGLFFVTLLLNVSVLAQVPMTKQINQIKRDDNYLYAEATMADADEALTVAQELLMQQVQEYIQSQPELSKADNVLVKDIGSNSESLSMMRGTMYRMFVYVDKRSIEVVNNAVTIKKVNEVQPVGEKELAPPQKVEPEIANETPAKELSSEHEASVEETVEASTPNAPTMNLPQWQVNTIASLANCSNINEALSKLKRLKAEYKIKNYGTPQQCRSISDSYWIVFGNDGSVTELLGPGVGNRVGFKTNTQATLDSYKGMDAIWFNFAK